jgi:hypothetical protein
MGRNKIFVSTAVAVALQCAAVSPCLAEDITRQSATGGCMLFIKKLLHDPDSATFDHSREASVILKGNRAMVIRSVRANNAFGAKRLTEFMCLMELNNGIITPVLITPRGENSDQARALLKKWKML